MAAVNQSNETPRQDDSLPGAQPKRRETLQRQTWQNFLRKTGPMTGPVRAGSPTSIEDFDEDKKQPEKWSLGVLNDKETDEVPGRVLLCGLVHIAVQLHNAIGDVHQSNLQEVMPYSE
ncbi:MAG: hypothetical protein LQ347_004158 [Umbilicaria vellea]|nr:MAG: hypothetical protein LQ347_004158 [Umbilicaria vellea]